MDGGAVDEGMGVSEPPRDAVRCIELLMTKVHWYCFSQT